MKKNPGYYMSLKYPVEIIEIDENEGGGYQASIPMLGRYAFLGDGETIEEAINNLNRNKEYLFQKYIDEGIPNYRADKTEGKGI